MTKRRVFLFALMLALVLTAVSAVSLADPTGNLRSGSIPESENNQKGTLGKDIYYTVTGVFNGAPNWNEYSAVYQNYMGKDSEPGFPKITKIEGAVATVAMQCENDALGGGMIGALQFALTSELEEHGGNFRECPSCVMVRMKDDAIFSDWAANWDTKIASIESTAGTQEMNDGEEIAFSKLFTLKDSSGNIIDNDGGLNFNCEVPEPYDMFAIAIGFKDNKLSITFNNPFPAADYIDLPLTGEIVQNGKALSAIKTVRLHEVTPYPIKLDKTNIALAPGATAKITAVTNPAGRKVVWETNDEDVATVDQNGLVTAVGVGEAFIDAFIEGTDTYASCVVTVEKVNKLKLAYEVLAIAQGKTFKVAPPKGCALAWTSGDISVATVAKSGAIKGVSLGTTTVSCVVTNVSKKADPSIKIGDEGEIEIRIRAIGDVVTGVKPAEKKLTMKVGETYKISAPALAPVPSNPEDRLLFYSSNKPSVATLSDDGIIRAVGKGKAKLTVMSTSGKKGVITVTVKK